MDNMLYEALSHYVHVLETFGYMSYKEMEKLLVFSFFRDFVYHDYRGLLSKEDYYQIERALNCLYGTSCLIPYPNYLKMGKLHLGETTEMAHRLKKLEETDVVKVIHDLNSVADPESDLIISMREEE